MSRVSPLSTRSMIAGAAAIALLATAGGYGLGQWRKAPAPAAGDAPGRKILYWYDPMVPAQRFDKPGKSPFMDMQLVPRYADESRPDAPGVTVDPRSAQTLGMRLARAEMTSLAPGLTIPGSIEFNQRDLAIVQTRTPGFVQRVYGHAPGDVIAAGAPIADLFNPDWAGAQTEYLAVRRIGDPRLKAAARCGLWPRWGRSGLERRHRQDWPWRTCPAAAGRRDWTVRPGLAGCGCQPGRLAGWR